MSPETSADDPQTIQDMFARIAPRYELANHVLTGWQDRRWRRFVAQQAELPPRGFLLDLGAGTGSLSQHSLALQPDIHPISVDFTPRMMHIGRQNTSPDSISWSAADALQLPFPENTFDAVVCGFLLRNVSDLERCLREAHRVLKPGGSFVSLDTTQPPTNLLTPLIRCHMQQVIPRLGKWITGNEEAYQYLQRSSAHFLRAEKLLAYLAAFGFQKLQFRRFMFGTIAVHWGKK